MARALIYKRSVDAVLVDIELGEIDPSKHGIKIKEEPYDGEIFNHDDSPSMGKNTESSNCDYSGDGHALSPIRTRSKNNKHVRCEEKFNESLSNVVHAEDPSLSKADEERMKLNGNRKDSPAETLKNTPKKKSNGSLPRRLNNSCDTPSKKMRQTILTDFISLRSTGAKNKSVEHQSQTSDISDDESSKLLQDIKMSTLVKCAETPTTGNKKPFVRIHMYPNLMMSLLSDNEITSPATFDTPCGTPYNFRSARNSSSSKESEHSRNTKEFRKRKRSSDTPKRSPKSERPFSLERKLKSRCKECVVYLERCDRVYNGANMRSSKSEGIISQQACSRQVKEELEDPEEMNEESNVPLNNVEVPSTRSPENVKPKNELTTPEQQSELPENNVKSNQIKLFRCNFCKKLFLSKENRREHKELFHAVYMSSICNARFKLMSALLRHYWQQHVALRRKKCCVCDEKFSNAMLLKQHLTLHCVKVVQTRKDTLPIDVEPNCNVFKKHYRCKGCRKRFLLKSCLTQHKKVCSRWKASTNDKRQDRSSVSKVTDNGKSSSVNEKQVSNVPSRATPHKIVEMPVENLVKIVTYPPNSNDPPLEPRSMISKSPINGMAYAQGYQINTLANSTFPCSICDKQFRTFPNLCIHERTFCKPLVNRCSTCGTAFPTKKLLQIHILATHTLMNTERYKFVCKFCKQGFTKRMNLQIHERHLHVNQIPSKSVQSADGIFNVNTVCNVCNLMFESYERFVQHNMYYYKEQTFTCMVCPESFQGMYVLHRHYKLMHRAKGKESSYNYTCDVCNEMFNYDSHLHSHKWHVHLHHDSSEQTSLNPIQDHSYALTSNMDVSTAELLGLPVRMFGCNVCDLHFTSAKDLWVHKLEYSTDGDFHCKICNRRYSSNAALAKHQSLSHSDCDANVYKCCFCEEVLTTSTSILCHERHFHLNDTRTSLSNGMNTNLRHLDKASLLDILHGNFDCLICDTRFKTLADLKVHLLEYSNIGTFNCTVCNRKFTNCYVLEVHKLKHTTLSATMFRHRCPICNEGFTTAMNVLPHVLHLHRYEIFGNKCVKTDMLAESLPIVNNTQENTTCSMPVMLANNAEIAASYSDQPKQSSVNCPECDISFSSPKHLNKHRSRFYNRGNYECPKCGRKFLWLKLMQAHLKKHSAKTSLYLKYKCPHCDDKFRSTVAVYSHIVHVHGKDKVAPPIRNTSNSNNNVVPCDSTVTVNEENAAKDADRSKEAGIAAETVKDGSTSKRLKGDFTLTRFNKSLTEFSYANAEDSTRCVACGSSFVDQQQLDKHMRHEHITRLHSLSVDPKEINEPEPTSSSEQISGPESTSSSEQIGESEQASSSEQINEPEPISSFEQINGPEPSSSSEQIKEPINETEQAGSFEKINEFEHASKFEQIDKPELTSSFEQIKEPEQTSSSEPINELEPTSSSEPINESEQADNSEKINEPEQASSFGQINEPEQASSFGQINEPGPTGCSEQINEPEQASSFEQIKEPEQTSSSERTDKSDCIELVSSPERHDVDVVEMVWEKNAKSIECVTIDESSNDSDIQMIDTINCRPSVIQPNLKSHIKSASSENIVEDLKSDTADGIKAKLFARMVC